MLDAAFNVSLCFYRWSSVFLFFPMSVSMWIILLYSAWTTMFILLWHWSWKFLCKNVVIVVYDGSWYTEIFHFILLFIYIFCRIGSQYTCHLLMHVLQTCFCLY